MKLYFAPMEGITGYIFRNAHKEMFGGCDAYFAPFITPSESEKTSIKNMKDILPENNKNIPLIVQAIVNKAEPFISFASQVKELGYNEVNINYGCPAGTVVKKGRGAGALCDTFAMESCLDKIFSLRDVEISIKTRSDFYNGVPDMEAFKKAYEASSAPVCYNGNISTAEDYSRIKSDFPELDSVMIGRGAIANPAIFREIRGGKKLTTHELVSFSDRLSEDYLELLQSDVFTLNKMKEVWVYMLQNFPEEKKIAKAIKKSKNLSEMKSAIGCLPDL